MTYGRCEGFEVLWALGCKYSGDEGFSVFKWPVRLKNHQPRQKPAASDGGSLAHTNSQRGRLTTGDIAEHDGIAVCADLTAR